MPLIDKLTEEMVAAFNEFDHSVNHHFGVLDFAANLSELNNVLVYP
jgi:hypothetical protein